MMDTFGIIGVSLELFYGLNNLNSLKYSINPLFLPGWLREQYLKHHLFLFHETKMGFLN